MNFANWGFGGGSSTSVKPNVMEEVMRNGNVPVAGKMGPGMGGGGVVPPALLDENRVPKFYQEAIAACGATNSSMLPNTALVYNMMVTSGLPRPVLSYIWSAVNRSLPGQLTRPEFFSCMALIALAQKGESLAALSTMSSLPIPFFQPCTVPVQSAPVVSVVKPPPPPSSSNPVKGPSKQKAFSQPPPSSSTSSDLLSEMFSYSSGSGFGSSGSTSNSGTGVTTSSEQSLTPTTSKSSSEPPLSQSESVDWSTSLNSEKEQSSEKSSDRSEKTDSLFSSPLSSSVPVKKQINSDQLECFARVVCGCSELLEQADTLWPANKESILREVAETQRGESYLQALEKTVSVLDRVLSSSNGLLPPDLSKRANAARKIWERLKIVIIASEKEQLNDSEAEGDCGICSQGIPISNQVGYGGRVYHSECANLWVNKVNPLLPNLHLR